MSHFTSSHLCNVKFSRQEVSPFYTECLQMNGAISEVNKKFLTLHGQNVHR